MRRTLLLASLCLLLLPAGAQDERGVSTKKKIPRDPQFDAQRNREAASDLDLAREQQRLRMKQRYQDIRQDSDKLLKLANDLKTEVEKADENTLSINVITKAEQIEKLAKSVRNKMKQTETPIE